MIRIENAVKRYGRSTVLDDVSLRFEKGGIHGLIGRNGSGKTVLLKCIAGLCPLTSGHIWVRGREVGRDVEIPPRMGAIIETPGFLPGASGYANLKLLADIRGRIGKREIWAAMERVGLDPALKKHVSAYSLGMRQRLGIAQAIMEKPKLLLLDEPMNGLDDEGVRDMRALFAELRDGGATILLASHNPLDIQTLCDSVQKMEHGRCVRLDAAQGDN